MYFSIVPNIVYDEKPIKYPFSDAERVVAKNFFRRYKLNDDIFSYAVFFNKYAIKDGERPDILAQQIYENVIKFLSNQDLRAVLLTGS